jgi:hypothetical protein
LLTVTVLCHAGSSLRIGSSSRNFTETTAIANAEIIRESITCANPAALQGHYSNAFYLFIIYVTQFVAASCPITERLGSNTPGLIAVRAILRVFQHNHKYIAVNNLICLVCT